MDRTPRKINDSKYLFESLKDLGVNQRGLSRWLASSPDSISYWACGYRLIPRSFKRAIIVLKFIKERGLMEELKEYIKRNER